MTYDLDTPAKGPALADTTAALPMLNASDVPAVAFDLNDPAQRFLAGRHWLAEGDDVFVRAVDHLVQNGWVANDRNEHGDALLHVAVRSARWASVTWLLEHGADPSQANNHGHTPVWLARRRPARHLPPAFRQLVDEARDQGLLNDPTPTAKATRPTRSARKSAQALPNASTPSVPSSTTSVAAPTKPVKPAKPVREPRAARPTVVVSAEAQRFTQALIGNDRAQMMQMLAEGFDLGSHNEQGNTVLHEALARNAWEWTDRLINYGAPLLARDRQGKTVLDHVERRWEEQDEALDLDRYETFQDALADEKAAQRVALGQGVTRSTKSLFKDTHTQAAIDWKGLPEDPDRPARPSGNAPGKSMSRAATRGGKPHKGSRGMGHSTSRRAGTRKNTTGKPPRKGNGGNNGQPNPLVTGLGQGKKSSLDRPLREASDYHVPRGATLAPDVVIVRKVRRTLVKP